jgi:hypothetical protein
VDRPRGGLTMYAPEPSPTDGRLPIVFDLDETLAEGTWPSNHIGAPISEGIELMLHYSEQGYAIVIHTARPVSHEARIWRWLEDLGLSNVVFNVVCGKPLGCLYVDDRSFRPDYVDKVKAEPVRVVAREEDQEEEPRYPEGFNDNEWTVVG